MYEKQQRMLFDASTEDKIAELEQREEQEQNLHFETSEATEQEQQIEQYRPEIFQDEELVQAEKEQKMRGNEQAESAEYEVLRRAVGAFKLSMSEPNEVHVDHLIIAVSALLECLPILIGKHALASWTVKDLTNHLKTVQNVSTECKVQSIDQLYDTSMHRKTNQARKALLFLSRALHFTTLFLHSIADESSSNNARCPVHGAKLAYSRVYEKVHPIFVRPAVQLVLNLLPGDPQVLYDRFVPRAPNQSNNACARALLRQLSIEISPIANHLIGLHQQQQHK